MSDNNNIMLVSVNVVCVTQLQCCAVESRGWHLYRSSEWFRQFGARDEDELTYEGMVVVFTLA